VKEARHGHAFTAPNKYIRPGHGPTNSRWVDDVVVDDYGPGW